MFLSDPLRYIMTFGSFIGYSASFPKLIKDVFCYLPDGEPESFEVGLYITWRLGGGRVG